MRRVFLFIAAALVLAFVALVYRRVEHAALVWDDHILVEGEPAYSTKPLADVMTEAFWPESPLADARALPYYRPVVLLSYRGDMALGGRAEEFHLTNLLLHLTACAFLAIVAVRLGASYPGAVGAMLVWGVMPRLTEAVVWVAGRTDVLAALFGLGALAVWPEMSLVRSKRPWPRAVLGALLLFAALCSKEVALAYVVVLVLASWIQRADPKRAIVTVGLPVLAYGALRTIALAGRSGTHRPLGFWTRAETVLEAAERYPEMTLDALRSRSSIGIVGYVDTVRAALGAVVLVLALVLAWRVARKASFGVRIGLALAAVAIAPTLHVIPIGLAGSVAADRLLYTPLAGLALAAAVAVRPTIAFAAPALALILGAATAKRVDDYRDETTFWTVAAEKSDPHNTMARLALGGWLAKAGEIPLACRLFERATKIATTPAQHGRARENLANCYARQGRYEDALEVARGVVADEPENARAELAVGFALLHLRAFDEADVAFERAVRRDPTLAPYRPSHAKLMRIRSDDVLYRDPYDRALSPGGYANHLAALGRGPDAEAAFLALVEDEDAEEYDRQDGAKYLIVQGSLADADFALAVVPQPGLGWDDALLYLLRRRHRIHDAVVALRPRIDALAEQAPSD